MSPKSLAGSKKKYVKMQIKVIPNQPKWNVQGRGEKVNRNYGVADTVLWVNDIDPELLDYLLEMPKHYRSMAPQSKERYFVVYARVNESLDTLSIQVPYMEEFNREYGAHFEIDLCEVPEDLRTFIYDNQEG